MLNQSDAIIIPAFAIREPLHPNTYELTENLEAIVTPIIPLASNCNHYSGDENGNEWLEYKSETILFIKRLVNQPALDRLPTRDIYTKRILERYGFSDVTLVGDLGWYHDDYLREPMRIPDTMEHIVMTTPHNAHYLDQAKDSMDMLVEEFPGAAITCSFHSWSSHSDKTITGICGGTWVRYHVGKPHYG